MERHDRARDDRRDSDHAHERDALAAVTKRAQEDEGLPHDGWQPVRPRKTDPGSR